MRALWRVAEVAMWGFFVVIFLDKFWSPLRAGNPTLDFRGLVEHQQAGLLTGAFLAMFVTGVAYRLSRPARKIERVVERWQRPSGPGAEASPMDALRFFPVHTVFLVCLVIAAVVAFWVHPGAGMLLVAAALMAAVTLARRLGLEPLEDPAAPQNQQRSR